MRRKRKIRVEIFALCCSLIVVLLGAIPLFDKHNDALILTLFFGSVAVGASLTSLIRDARDKKKEE
jgi:hypothetical protein